MFEYVPGLNNAQIEYDNQEPPMYEVRPGEGKECICCGEEWNPEDGKEYANGFVCDDCRCNYITKNVLECARDVKFVQDYIKSDPEIEKDFYMKWVFPDLQEKWFLKILKGLFEEGTRIITIKDETRDQIIQSYAEESEGFREYVEGLLEV